MGNLLQNPFLTRGHENARISRVAGGQVSQVPHAVIKGARECPSFGPAPLDRERGIIHKVGEVAQTPIGWLLRSLVVANGAQTRFFTRIDRREDGLVIHLDDHMHVDRTPLVFDHLALIARRVLDANPGSSLGATNLQDRIPASVNA